MVRALNYWLRGQDLPTLGCASVVAYKPLLYNGFPAERRFIHRTPDH